MQVSSVSSVARPREPQGLTSQGDRRFRPDIQGLRTVAVVLVVLYHCAVPWIPGGYVGVDVFFVISGFLITRQLITEHHRAGRISLSSFYARRIKRLLPMALTVILTTEVLARFWGPPLQSSTVAKDGIFATFYLMNYRLAAQGIDYQNAGGPVSPLQHFWSLAVEEQFYIFWPLAIILLGLVFRSRIRTAALLAVGVGVIVSFVVSIVVTDHDATLAYFAIQTRAWELGVGAAIALGTPLIRRVPPVVQAVASWLGVGLIAASAVVFTDATHFPGAAAAFPVVGAAMVMVSGLTPSSAGAELLLGRPVMQFGGRMSYGWYLWHWPLIVLAPALLHVTYGWWGNLAVAAAGLALTVVTYHLIEQPVARRPARRGRWFAIGGGLSVLVTAVGVLITLLPTAGLYNTGPATALRLDGLTQASLSSLLQSAYDEPQVPSNLAPSLTGAVDDLPITNSDGCHAVFLATTEPPCVFGDPEGTRTIVLFGDSHAQQWFGGLDALARSRGWRLISWTKAACPLADALFYNAQLQRSFTECPTWRDNTITKIAALDPDLVIASGADALPGRRTRTSPGRTRPAPACWRSRRRRSRSSCWPTLPCPAPTSRSAWPPTSARPRPVSSPAVRRPMARPPRTSNPGGARPSPPRPLGTASRSSIRPTGSARPPDVRPSSTTPCCIATPPTSRRPTARHWHRSWAGHWRRTSTG